MANYLKFCSCVHCRAGRHTGQGKTQVKKVTRRFRHKARQACLALRKGEDVEVPSVASVTYTDY